MSEAPGTICRTRPRLSGAVRALLVSAAMAAALPAAAFGQGTRAVAIKVPPVVTAAPNGPTPLPIAIEPPGAAPGKSFVRIRGLPPMAALSEGYVIAAGAWAVPIAALPNLKITLPANASGRTELTVLLVAVDGSVLGEAKTALAIGAARAAAQPPERNAPAGAAMLRAGVPIDAGPRPSPAPAPVVPRTSPQDRERAMRLLTRGNEQLDEGNISAARLFFERAAEAGLPEGAMALAATFDAAELERLPVRGIRPDTSQARRWYERALQLGASGAEERLRRLGATN